MNLEKLDLRKLMTVITVAYDERKEIKTPAQINDHIVQFSNEITNLCDGFTQAETALIHRKAFETLEQFEKDPTLRSLF